MINKKILLNYTVLILLMTFFATCSEDEDGGRTTEKKNMGSSEVFSSKSNIINKKFFYKLGIPQGSQYRYTISSSNESVLEVNGKKVRSVSEIELGILYNIMTDSLSNSVFNISYDKIKIIIKSTGEDDQVYDASNTDSGERIDQLLGKIKASRFAVVMDSTGKLIRSAGIKELQDNIMEGFINEDLKLRDMMKQLVSQIAGESFIESNFGKKGMNVLGGRTLEEGMQWSDTGTYKSIIDFKTINTSKVATVDEDEIVVTTEGKFSNNADMQFIVGGQTLNAELAGEQESKVKTDPVTGLLVSLTDEVNVEGELFAQNHTIPIEIRIKRVVKQKKLK